MKYYGYFLLSGTVVKALDGGYLLAGYSSSRVSGEKTSPNQGGSDYWVVKISASGNVEWQKNFGGSADDNLFAAAASIDVGYILTGTSASPISGDKTTGVLGERDSWTIKIDSSGNLKWQKTIGGNGDDGFNSVLQNFDGSFLLTGMTNSSISGDIIQSPKGASDFAVKLEAEPLSKKNLAVMIN